MNNKQLYSEISRHLLHDEWPSLYLETLNADNALAAYPFSMLSRLSKIEQSPQHHPEGNVWNHTMLVVDEAAKVKNQSSDASVFVWAALLHDVGKAVTTKHRNGRITAYNHEKAGAGLAREFLLCFTNDTDFIDKVAALVRWHMQILFVAKGLPFADLSAMKREADPHEIALLGLCDSLGRTGVKRVDAQKKVLAFLEAVVQNPNAGKRR